jgi:glycosyltransferase involved in cell wall biosynthesis
VHLNNSPTFADLDWVPAAVAAGVPIVAHARGQILPARRRVVSLMYRAYRRVVAISENVRQSVVAAGFAPSRVELIYDGIDIASLRQSAVGQSALLRRECQIAEGEILGLMVGHLKEWKGQHVVLDALRRLPPGVRQQLRFVFVGQSPPAAENYVDRLTRLTSEWGLGNRVCFLGARQDVPAIMAASDLVVHASTVPEPFGLVVAEGMALGKPVIASCLGGPSEIISPGSGLLFDPACPDQLAAHLERLIGDPAERRQLGEAARVRAEEFDIGRNVSALEDLYERVLSGR